MKKKVQLMLDSGVFSAWNRKEKPLDIKQYIEYLKEHREYLFSYVNMDVIPGEWGQKRTTAQVEQSAKQGYDNLQTIKSESLHPMPVFHQGERWYWLERMLNDGEDYIGISTAKDLWSQEQARWLDEVFTIICNAKGRPLVKTHGFGITNPRLLLRYPFYTVDSTTWSLTPGYGQILVPPIGRDGAFDYTRPAVRVVVSGVLQSSPSLQQKQLEGMAHMAPNALAAVLRFLREVVDCDAIEARYSTSIRRKCVLTYYLELMKHVRDVRFTHFVGSMKSEADKVALSNRKVLKPDNLRIMFATSLSKEWSWLMNNAGATTRLLSYYELRKKDGQVLRDYVERGYAGEPYKPQAPKADWASEGYLNFRRLKLVKRLEAFNGQEDTA